MEVICRVWLLALHHRPMAFDVARFACHALDMGLSPARTPATTPCPWVRLATKSEARSILRKDAAAAAGVALATLRVLVGLSLDAGLAKSLGCSHKTSHTTKDAQSGRQHHE